MTQANGVERVKIVFRLEQDEETGYPPADTETVWAIPRNDGLFEIENVPFFIVNLACGDVVSATMYEGQLWSTGVAIESTNCTLRALMLRPEEITRVRTQLRELGCEVETSERPPVLAINVPKSVDYDELEAFLCEEEARQTLEYEEAALSEEKLARRASRQGDRA